MSNKILVIGSTGKTGSRIYNRLKSRGINVFSASRNSQIPFDWYHPETWSQALNGISVIYITFQPDLAVPASIEIITKFVKSAQDARVCKLVLLSGRGEPEAIACEKVIIGSGLEWIILRASFFMQNFSEGFWLDGILSKEFVIPSIQAKEPFVDADDIADVAVEVLTNSNHNGKIYELTGPELLSFKDIISKISSALKIDIKLIEISIDEYTSILKTQQVPEDVVWLIRYLFTEVLDGRNESVIKDVEVVLKRMPLSFDHFVQKTMDAGNWLTI